MKKLLIIAAVMVFTACNTTRKGRTTANVDGSAFDVIVVDSCEYLIGDCGYSGYMAHKGNCKYCEQRMKELWQKANQDATPTSLPTNTASDVRIGRNT